MYGDLTFHHVFTVSIIVPTNCLSISIQLHQTVIYRLQRTVPSANGNTSTKYRGSDKTITQQVPAAIYEVIPRDARGIIPAIKTLSQIRLSWKNLSDSRGVLSHVDEFTKVVGMTSITTSAEQTHLSWSLIKNRTRPQHCVV